MTTKCTFLLWINLKQVILDSRNCFTSFHCISVFIQSASSEASTWCLSVASRALCCSKGTYLPYAHCWSFWLPTARHPCSSITKWPHLSSRRPGSVHSHVVPSRQNSLWRARQTGLQHSDYLKSTNSLINISRTVAKSEQLWKVRVLAFLNFSKASQLTLFTEWQKTAFIFGSFQNENTERALLMRN